MYLGLTLLPVAAYALLATAFRCRTSVNGFAEALVKAHLVVFAFIAISTEALSIAKGISFAGLVATWSLFILGCLLFWLRRRSHQRLSEPRPESSTPSDYFLTSAIALILAMTFITAIVYPPNTWDSMTYHMPRVVHWMNQHSLDFYPTEIQRQLYQAPLAEYAILHLQLLTDGDRLANLVQWISFVLLIGLGKLIAEELGLNNRQQLVSAVLVATLPMAVLQASSTQNDLVVAVFLMSFALFMLRMRHQTGAENTVFAAIALGLALLTKGTAYVYAAALAPCLAISVLLASKDSVSRLLRSLAALALVACLALSFSFGHYWRNYQQYGHPLAASIQKHTNQSMSGALLAGNVIRNLTLHTGTPFFSINRFQYQLLANTLGTELNSPDTTLPGATFDITYYRHEDFAGNFLHVFIALLSVGVLALLWLRGRYGKAIWYATGVLLGALLYCWLIRWQPWASRLHTPLFVLAAPLMAIAVAGGRSRKQFGDVICILSVLYSLLFVLHNPSRSIMSLDWLLYPRNYLYFTNKPPIERIFGDYQSALGTLERFEAKEVGLFLGQDDWEYPIWVFSGCAGRNCPIDFRSVGVRADSGTSRPEESLPPFIVAIRPLEEWAYAPEYFPLYRSKSISVFRNLNSKE